MNKCFAKGLVAAAILATGFAAQAHQAGDIIVRAGAVTVAPNESSQDVAGLGEFEINNNTQLGLNFGYMVTDNIGVELLAATPFSHDVSLRGVGKIAETKHLPPTLVVQYYFGKADSQLRPYIGAGVNFTNFFDNDFKKNDAAAPLNLNSLSIKNSWGFAAQVGLDYQVNKNWLVNASVWYADIGTDVKFKAGDTPITIKTDVNPMVYMVSVGYTF